ncbi:MAG: hypothetical protein Q4A12_05100 [Eubacteriales bacterium]|nr:hypothetical protein [Eubacteriales bacterium]
MKRIIAVLLVMTTVFLLAACSCEHSWKDATCTDPKTCTQCGISEGKALGHYYYPATCTKAETCSRCGYENGVPKEHVFVDASCTQSSYCETCDKTKGEPLGHDYVDNVCTRCEDVIMLSESCDMVLVSGSESNGDFYELVANESESYEGVRLEIGVIKNNEWLLELTTDMPFVDKDGNIYGKKTTSIYENNNLKFFYLGNGCFLCESYMENMIYNCETQQYFEKKFENKYDHVCITYNCLTNFYGTEPNYSSIHMISKDNSRVITDFINYGKTADIEILDTNKMKSSTIRIDTPEDWINIGYVYPISNGIFAVANEDAKHNKIAFFNINGEQIIKNKYSLNTTDQNICFNNGKCSFDILNENNKPYSISIDRTGRVLSSTEI